MNCHWWCIWVHIDVLYMSPASIHKFKLDWVHLKFHFHHLTPGGLNHKLLIKIHTLTRLSKWVAEVICWLKETYKNHFYVLTSFIHILVQFEIIWIYLEPSSIGGLSLKITSKFPEFSWIPIRPKTTYNAANIILLMYYNISKSHKNH